MVNKEVVLIPTYNQASHIRHLIKEVRKYVEDVVIVDDGSCDNTAELAKKENAVVIRHSHNKGKGASLHTGIDYLSDKDYKILITMDGDGQHLPEEIPLFINFYEKYDADLIVGNRMHNLANMPVIRRLTNKIMSNIISKICHQEIPDSQCGFRLIKKKLLDEINLTYSNYEIESELLIRASRLGYKIDQVPITTVYKQEKSYINPIIDTIRFIKLLIDIRKR
jgi:glycosyltransferase involved in cell wall biosynthesis